MPVRTCTRIALIATAIVLAGWSIPAAAQSQTEGDKSNTTGIMLAFFLNGTSIDSDDFDDVSTGGGFAAQLGYGFGPKFTLIAGLAGARMDEDPEEFVLVHFDVIARFNFRSPAHAFVPFIEGGVSARVAGQDDAVLSSNGGPPQTADLEMAGGAANFGGGFHYFVSPTFALGANLQFSWGEFSTVELNDVEVEDLEIEANSARLNLGLTWYPMRRR